MPCDTRFGADRMRGSASRKPPRGLEPSSAWEWMSMNPGTTYRPVASITRVAVAPAKDPTVTMRPPRTPISAGNHGFPVPSSTRPLRTIRSYCCWAPAVNAGRSKHARSTTRESLISDQRVDVPGPVVSTTFCAATGLHQHIQHRHELLMGYAASLSGSRLVHDDEVEHRKYGEVLADRAESSVGAAIGTNRVRAVPHPPEVAVTEGAFTASRRIHFRDRRVRPRYLAHP